MPAIRVEARMGGRVLRARIDPTRPLTGHDAYGRVVELGPRVEIRELVGGLEYDWFLCALGEDGKLEAAQPLDGSNDLVRPEDADLLLELERAIAIVMEAVA
ncbi:MAG: hypothetical protein QME96_04545 [Myxococcota bacterium]|nr:hypothetical protein [Myxococcota bacterium]